MQSIAFIGRDGRIPSTWPADSRTWPGPTALTGESWTVSTPLRGMINIAGLVSPSLGTIPWLEANGLSIGQDGSGIRITIAGETLLIDSGSGWGLITLTTINNETVVIKDGQPVGTLPKFSTTGVVTLTGAVIIAPGAHRLGIAFTDETPWGIAETKLRHEQWRDALDAQILGASWDKGSSPVLTRTHDAVGLSAAVGLNDQVAKNDFDTQPIFGELHEVTDELGNVFVRIPKHYVRKVDQAGLKSWAVSKTKHPGFYLPLCFWDFDSGTELPFIDVGKYKASLRDGMLASEPDVHPLVRENIVTFRNLARANNVDGRRGYQQLDLHVVDVLRTLMFIEFGTLHMQSLMAGWTTGRNSTADVITVAEEASNRAIVAPATAARFAVGEPFAIGTGTSIHNVSGTPRIITAIEPDGDNMAILFDGPPIDTAVGNVVQNAGWVNGFSSLVAASSGGIGHLTNGLYPMTYRGIESVYGDVYQFVDGLNINDYQAWVAGDAEQYASNLFAEPYKQLGYVNLDVTNQYVTEMGYDPAFPFAELPVAAGGSSSTYYADYYYSAAGVRIARFGGHWHNGANAGASLWNLNSSSSPTITSFGGRLLKKPL